MVLVYEVIRAMNLMWKYIALRLSYVVLYLSLLAAFMRHQILLWKYTKSQ